MPTSNRIGWLFASSLGAAIALASFGQTNSRLFASTAIMQDEEADDQKESESESSEQESESESDNEKEEDKPEKKKKPKKKPKKGPEGTNVGESIKDIAGKDVEGVKFSLADYEGKVVMLDFWGDW